MNWKYCNWFWLVCCSFIYIKMKQGLDVILWISRLGYGCIHSASHHGTVTDAQSWDWSKLPNLCWRKCFCLHEGCAEVPVPECCMGRWDQSREWITTGFTGAEPGSSLTCVFPAACSGLEVSETLLLRAQPAFSAPLPAVDSQDNLWDRVWDWIAYCTGLLDQTNTNIQVPWPSAPKILCSPPWCWRVILLSRREQSVVSFWERRLQCASLSFLLVAFPQDYS